jgi:hypothetical protein
VTSTEASSTFTQTQTATETNTSENFSTDTRTETTTATATETTISDNFSTGEDPVLSMDDGLDLLTNGSDITTAPAETSFITQTQVSEITVTAFSTITESASCDASSTTSTTDNGLPPIYAGPTTTTTITAVSACATPAGKFVIQLDNINLYLTNEFIPISDKDVNTVTTDDYANAILFSAATDGNGQTTLVSSDSTTLFSDQDSVVGSGDGPIYWDSYNVYSDGDYFPVQFCLQPDNTFVVQNRLDTNDTTDDANVVQVCADDVLYLQTPAVAASSNCNTVILRLAQIPPGYPNPAANTTTTSDTQPSITTTTSDTQSSTTSDRTSSTTTTSSPSVSMCVPVPDGQQFRVSVVDGSEYLIAAAGAGGATPDDQTLVTTTDYNQALPFKAAPGRDAQITFVRGDGTTLYSDQDLGGNGDGPVYFDDLDTFENSNMFPMQFCLQPDNTFVVQNQGNDKQDPADDANLVQICAADGAVYLYTADRALISGCSTVRLQIAPVPNRFRMRLTSNSQYITSDPPAAVPNTNEIAFTQTPGSSLALTFERTPDQSGRIFVYNAAGNQLYPDQNAPYAQGTIFANLQADMDAQGFNPVLFFVQPDGTITVQNNGNNPDSSDDANTVTLWPNDPDLSMYASIATTPSGCVVQTLTAEFVP